MKILLVDDDPFMLKFLTRILSKNSMEITCFTHPQDAAQSLKNQGFDLIISDVMMPEVNGVELTFWLQKHAPNIPVILISSIMTDEIKAMGESVGVVATLKKPFEAEALLSLIYKIENPGITGYLDHVNPVALIEILLLNPKHRVLQVNAPESDSTILLYIRQSHVIHAEKRLLGEVIDSGQHVLEKVLSLTKGHFQEVAWTPAPQQSIHTSFENIVMTLGTRMDESLKSSYGNVHKQMLIFENNPSDMAHIKKSLESFSYKIKYAQSLEEAQTQLKTEDFDFVLQNLELKDPESTTLFKLLLTQYPHIKVGFMSHQLKKLKSQLQDDEDIMIFQKPLALNALKKHMDITIQLGLKGKIKDISPLDLIQLNMRNQGERKRISIRDHVRNTQGTLYFEWGRLIHAEYEKTTGEAAFFEVIKIKQGFFDDEGWVVPAQRSLADVSIQKLMLKAFSGQNNAQIAPELMASIEARLKLI